MAERDSTKTPVAAEALIAAAAPLALHRIPRGRPAPASGCARAPRGCPSRRPAPRRARPARAPPVPRPQQRPLCAPARSRPVRRAAAQSREAPCRPPAQRRWGSTASAGRRRGVAKAPCPGTGVPRGARSAGRWRPGRRAQGAAGSLSSTTRRGSGPSCGPA
ncbi:transcriptional regulatory protein AlgP-like [Odocoileus virginianus]|uniref:Transcriptional regulatory protein AlgP-like n=1 Tax=Odocoileus virginianus TaxID=9874 RepID=A0ABM4J2T3_ODOVR